METSEFHAALDKVWVTPFIGASIRFWRELRGWTQKQPAAATGMTLSAIKRLERGRKNGGWLLSIEVVSRALGITLEELVHHAKHLAELGEVKRLFLKKA